MATTTHCFIEYQATDDGPSEPDRIAYVLRGGNSFTDGDSVKRDATRFFGHGSGRGPVYHSTTLGGDTVDLIVDSTTGLKYKISGTAKWKHSYWGYRTDYVFARYIGTCWHVVQVRVDPWDAAVSLYLMGHYHSKLMNCVVSPGDSITGPLTGIRVSYSRAKELANLEVGCIPVIEEMYDMLHPAQYLSFGSYKYNSFTVLRNWESPRCPFLSDYELCCEFGPILLSQSLRIGLGNATLNMVDNLPRTDVNLIATCVDLIKIVKGDVQAISSLADAWLSYRYVYTTNKLDIKAMKTYLKRLSQLSKGDSLTAYGRYTDGSATYYCQAKLSTANPDVVRVQELAKEAHRQLSLVNAWDLVPWSFVVDWILPIEDVCRVLDDTAELATLKPLEVWYSVKSNAKVSNLVYERTYMRFPPLQQFITTPLSIFNTGGETSDRTKLFRAIDAVALILGR